MMDIVLTRHAVDTRKFHSWMSTSELTEMGLPNSDHWIGVIFEIADGPSVPRRVKFKATLARPYRKVVACATRSSRCAFVNITLASL